MILLLSSLAAAQIPGPISAVQFSGWSMASQGGVGNPGVQGVTLVGSQVVLSTGQTIPPVALFAPLLVLDGTNTETVVPTTVNCPQNGTCFFVASFAFAHGNFTITSGTFGLQEAINYGLANGGGTVQISGAWGGLQSMITSALGSPAVTIVDLRNNGIYVWDNIGHVYVLSSSGPGGGVVSVTASAPLTASAGVSPNIALPAAGAGVDGYLKGTDWTIFNAKQAALGFTPENVANKAQANGYASLDGTSKVPIAQIATGACTNANFIRGDRACASVPAAGLADPGGNGIVKRTALNTTSIAAAADIFALWSGTCNAASFLRGDGSCQPVVTGSGTTGTIPTLSASNIIANSDMSDNLGVSVTIGVPVIIAGSYRIDAPVPVGACAAASVGMSALCFNQTTGRLATSPNAAAVREFVDKKDLLTGSLTTAAAATDNVAIIGMTAGGHCTMSPTNANAATDSTSTFISNKTTDQITVSHPVSAGRTWDIVCVGTY